MATEGSEVVETFAFSIPSFRPDSNRSVEYELCCDVVLGFNAGSDKKQLHWSCWKTFEDFSELDSQLRRKFPSLMRSITFAKEHSTSKLFGRTKSPKFLSRRRQELEEYIQKVGTLPNATEFHSRHGNQVLRQFCEYDTKMASVKASGWMGTGELDGNGPNGDKQTAQTASGDGSQRVDVNQRKKADVKASRSDPEKDKISSEKLTGAQQGVPEDDGLLGITPRRPAGVAENKPGMVAEDTEREPEDFDDGSRAALYRQVKESVFNASGRSEAGLKHFKRAAKSYGNGSSSASEFVQYLVQQFGREFTAWLIPLLVNLLAHDEQKTALMEELTRLRGSAEGEGQAMPAGGGPRGMDERGMPSDAMHPQAQGGAGGAAPTGGPNEGFLGLQRIPSHASSDDFVAVSSLEDGPFLASLFGEVLVDPQSRALRLLTAASIARFFQGREELLEDLQKIGSVWRSRRLPCSTFFDTLRSSVGSATAIRLAVDISHIISDRDLGRELREWCGREEFVLEVRKEVNEESLQLVANFNQHNAGRGSSQAGGRGHSVRSMSSDGSFRFAGQQQSAAEWNNAKAPTTSSTVTDLNPPTPMEITVKQGAGPSASERPGKGGGGRAGGGKGGGSRRAGTSKDGIPAVVSSAAAAPSPDGAQSAAATGFGPSEANSRQPRQRQDPNLSSFKSSTSDDQGPVPATKPKHRQRPASAQATSRSATRETSSSSSRGIPAVATHASQPPSGFVDESNETVGALPVTAGAQPRAGKRRPRSTTHLPSRTEPVVAPDAAAYPGAQTKPRRSGSIGAGEDAERCDYSELYSHQQQQQQQSPPMQGQGQSAGQQRGSLDSSSSASSFVDPEKAKILARLQNMGGINIFAQGK